MLAFLNSQIRVLNCLLTCPIFANRLQKKNVYQFQAFVPYLCISVWREREKPAHRQLYDKKQSNYHLSHEQFDNCWSHYFSNWVKTSYINLKASHLKRHSESICFPQSNLTHQLKIGLSVKSVLIQIWSHR